MAGLPENHKTAFSVTNCICHDQRVQKMAGALEEYGTDITIIGRKKGACCATEGVPWKTRRFRMIFRKGFLFYKFYNIRLFFYLLFHKFDLLVANDLDTLLPNYLVSLIRGVPVVYDSHEYFTGVPELQNRHFVRWIWRSIERIIFPRLEYLITVSDPIAEQYFKEYGKRPVTIRNCSKSSDHILPLTRNELGIAPGNLVLIMQGTGLNIHRGGEELVEAMVKCENVSLLIVGSGDVMEKLRERAVYLKLTGRIKFVPKLPWEEMMRYTKTADVGMSLDKDNNMNYRFSLPNKLFDYISAGIPVIAGDLPEVTRIITANTCGIIIPAINPDEISEAIRLLDSNRDLLNVLKQNARAAAETLTWESESAKVKTFYNLVFANTVK
jgi:glycosyltransferase involved in cell wall biosynthesis